MKRIINKHVEQNTEINRNVGRTSITQKKNEEKRNEMNS